MASPALLVAGSILETARTRFRIMLEFRKHAILQPRSGRHQLKHRRRRVSSRNGAVGQGPQGIQGHLSPSLVAFALFQRENIRVQPGRTHHGKNFSITGIYGNQSTSGRIRNGLFCHLLQFQIDSRYQMESRYGSLAIYPLHLTDFAAGGVHLHHLHTVCSAELLVIKLFQPFLANTVTLGVIFVFRQLQLFF